MGKRVVVDPITRIEGHLRIEVEVAGGKVVNAWSSGQMFRGIELISAGTRSAGCAPFRAALLRCLNLHAMSVLGEGSGNAIGVKIPKMPESSATCCTAPSSSTITWSIFIICTPWTGSTLSAP
jgi:[NiFe] hydrogenase large subunit